MTSNEGFFRRWILRPVWAKLALIAALAAVLVIPINMTESLVLERRARMESVVAELAQKWGNELTLRGPILVIDDEMRRHGAFVLPAKLETRTQVRVEERHRGIFTVPTYRAAIDLVGSFNLAGVPSMSGASLAPESVERQATLQVLIEPGALPPNQATLTWAGRATTPTFAADGGQGVLSAEVGLAPLRAGNTVPFTLHLEVQGISSLQLAPLAATSRTVMASAWPHPSFVGDRLPTEHDLGRKGFSATWELSAQSLGVPAVTLAEIMPPQIAAAPAVGVRFFDPVDHYLQVTRAVKHAVLVILLTFAALFLLEVLARLRVHPVQYLLVGCALTVFYLLLLSLSEQVAFPIAYGAASGAVVLLVAGYTAAVLGRWQRGLAVSCGLALVYGILFVILRAEQLALLAGSITVFLALAALMLTTRRVDWYSLDRRPAPGSGPAQTPLTD